MAKKRGKKTESTTTSAGTPSAGQGGGIPSVPRWVPATLFVVLAGILFRAFVISDLMLVGNDTLGGGYVARALYARLLKAGSFPLWSPEILGGTPFIEALSGGDSLYPPSLLLLLLLEPYRALGWKLVLHILAAGFFMFGWIRALGGSRPAALVSGVGYMLAPMLVSFVRPGHDGKLFVMALAPLLFWAVERHFARASARSFAGIALVVALVVLTTHFQMAYFLFGGAGLYAIFRTLQETRAGGGTAGEESPAEPPRRTRAGLRLGLFLVASVTGVAAAGVQFLPAVAHVREYSRRVETTRDEAGEVGRAWSSSWSLHPEEAMSVLVPQFAGNNAGGAAWASNTYWGRNATKDNLETAGVLLLLLAAVSFAGGARKGVRWFLAGLGGTAFLFALGTHTPVWGLFYALVPGIRLFRAPSMTAFLFVFAVATLAGLGFDRLLRAAREGTDDGWRGPLRVLWGGTGVFALLWLLTASGALQQFWTTAVYPEASPRQLQAVEAIRPLVAQGALVSLLLAGGGAVLAWAVKRAYLAPVALVAGTVLLVAVDQLRVDGPFVQVMDFHAWARPDPNLQAILDAQRGKVEPYRLLSFAHRGQDVTPAMYGIELAAGHHPNDLARYRDLIGMVGSDEPRNLYDGDIRRLLNVRYLIWPDWQNGELDDQPGILSRTRLSDGRVFETLLAEEGLPRARLVASAVVKSGEEAVPYMLSDAFDPVTQAVLSEPPPLELPGGPVAGEVRWEERGPNRLRLSVVSDRPALLVVADNWYPAWRASVDGEEAPVLRAYHTLRAVPVQAGSHTVEMWYDSGVLSAGLWLSLFLLPTLLGIWGVGTLREERGL